MAQNNEQEVKKETAGTEEPEKVTEPEKSEDTEKAPEAEKAEKAEKNVKAEKTEKPEKPEKPEKEKKASKKAKAAELDKAKADLAAEHDQYLRLAAEYDNFRKRSQREKDALYQEAQSDTVKKFLPVYDNLLRALSNETADEAYKKGVELIMADLKKTLAGMNIQPFGEAGETFDPEKHNAVMHVEDENLGENVIADVFQVGFSMGEKVIRFAMVKVAN